MEFKTNYYTDEKGFCPVDVYIQRLDEQQNSKVYAYLRLLEQRGFALRRPIADSLGSKSGLYELRPGRHRILYCFHERKHIVLLHAFLKKTQEIPVREIRIALDRKKDFERLLQEGLVDLSD